jgi:hypothetical protein
VVNDILRPLIRITNIIIATKRKILNAQELRLPPGGAFNPAKPEHSWMEPGCKNQEPSCQKQE